MSPVKSSPGKLDFKKDFKALYAASAKEPSVVDVPAFKYLMIDGRGHPGKSPDFQKKIEALFGLAYTLKFSLKFDKKKPLDFTVTPLSGLYSADDPSCFQDQRRQAEWKWTLGIPVPDAIDAAALDKAKAVLRERKNPEFLDEAYLKVLKEGPSVQIMHIGPYDREVPTIRKLHAFMAANGYTFNGAHNEIYLGDPRRANPAKLKTIIRQPVRKK
jgi:hypothetical protein